eukprot:477761-Pelagomonas_calceolata.AAC.3
MQMLAAPTSDACATTVHAVTAADACSGSYWARGLFASKLITEALAAARDGRGEALWNAAADLAGLPSWTRSIEDFHVPSKEARVHK